MQLLIHDLTHVIQLFVVVRLHGSKVLVDCHADILQILRGFRGKAVQPPLKLAKLIGHRAHFACKAFVHRGKLAHLRLAPLAQVLVDERTQRGNGAVCIAAPGRLLPPSEQHDDKHQQHHDQRQCDNGYVLHSEFFLPVQSTCNSLAMRCISSSVAAITSAHAFRSSEICAGTLISDL